MSKRAQLREKRRRERIRGRAVTILVIVGGALLLVFVIVYPSIKPIGEIVLPEFRERPMADGRAMGDPNAPVTIEVFSDFQCPACVGFSTTVEPLIEEVYVATGDVYYIYRHYAFLDDNAPGEESDQSASASMCAADQDRFWDYHDIVIANWNSENQGAYSDRRLIAFAEQLGLEMADFEECFESRIHYDLVSQDFDLGGEMLVTGTPAVFVNGEHVTPGYVPSFAQVIQVVDSYLTSPESE